MAVCVGCGLAISGAGKLVTKQRDGGCIDCNEATGIGVKLDPAGGISCGANGLAVTFPAPPAAYTPVRSDEPCNGFIVRGNGSLFAHCPDAVTAQIGNDSINNDLIAGAGLGISFGGGPYLLGSGPANVIGNHTCCEVGGIIAIRAGGLYLSANDGFYGTCRLQVNANGTGLVDASPDGKMVFENRTGFTVRTAFNNFVDENWITIPASPGSITYAAALVVEVLAGAGQLTGFVKFEYIVALPQIGCC